MSGSDQLPGVQVGQAEPGQQFCPGHSEGIQVLRGQLNGMNFMVSLALQGWILCP